MKHSIMMRLMTPKQIENQFPNVLLSLTNRQIVALAKLYECKIKVSYTETPLGATDLKLESLIREAV